MECGQQVLDQISQPERFEVKKLIDKMIHEDKDQRPLMTEVVKAIEKWRPIDPVNFNMEPPRASRKVSSASTSSACN